jgi:hypothetical protein
VHASIGDHLGIEFPIFAFSHCQDVVAAVNQVGGFGILGALGHTAEGVWTGSFWLLVEEADTQPAQRLYSGAFRGLLSVPIEFTTP